MFIKFVAIFNSGDIHLTPEAFVSNMDYILDSISGRINLGYEFLEMVFL